MAVTGTPSMSDVTYISNSGPVMIKVPIVPSFGLE